MKGLHFIQQKTTQEVVPERVDIACFVGFISMRDGAEIPFDLRAWLENAGWLNPNQPDFYRQSAQQLRDVPVPIESWDEFDRLFAWEQRPVNDALQCATWLGVAVKAFFAQGGRKCYVINAGEPFAYSSPRATRAARIGELLPGSNATPASVKHQRASWHGVGHLFGLPEVSFLSVPDLVDIFRSEPTAFSTVPPEAPIPEEHFVECSQELPVVEVDLSLAGIEPPRYTRADYDDWCGLVSEITDFVRRNTREVQLVCSLPLPEASDRMVRQTVLPYLYQARAANPPVWFNQNESTPAALESAFLQINYPWLKTRYDNRLPKSLEPGEGSLVGLLAKNALTRGTFRSAVPVEQNTIVDIYPRLSLSYMSGWQSQLNAAGARDRLEDRISLWQLNASGFVSLRSDVTTSANVLYRNASVGRTMAMIQRYARHMGEDFLFERNGENLWKQIRSRLNGYLNLLFQQGVLDGKNPAEAYSVRCDRSTITQQELDSGVVKAEVLVNITASLETMIIAFSVQGNNEPNLLASVEGVA